MTLTTMYLDGTRLIKKDCVEMTFLLLLFFRSALRPQKPYGLLKTGKNGTGNDS